MAETARKGIDGARELWDRAKTEAVELAKSTGIATLAEKLPGGAEVNSWIDEAKMLFKGYKDSVVETFDHAMSGAGDAAVTVGSGRTDTAQSGYHDRKTERVGRGVQKNAEEMAKESIKRK